MSVADSFVDAVTSGPVLLALPVAAAAGLVSFLSPCVLPLVPGYLSYVTGLSGADLGDDRTAPTPVRAQAPGVVAAAVGDRAGPAVVLATAGHPGRPGTTALPVPALRSGTWVRGRVLAGSVLFVLGFSAVFVTTGALFGGLGAALVAHKEVLDRVLGALTVLLGLAFLGLVPGMRRELRVHRRPDAGLAGAPLLGVLFGVGWTPCLGPTLGAVQTLAYTQASAGRGALLTAAYCLGLGLPFIATGLAMRRALGAFEVVRRHYGLVMKVGGGLLVAVGLLLVSGLWARIVLELQVLVGGFETAV